MNWILIFDLSAGQTVWNIRNKKEHCEQDPQQPRALTRKRKYNRNELSRENIEARLQYCTKIESLSLITTLLICVDEKGNDFGGTANNHVTAPRGEHRYQPTAPVRFRIEQWAASCGDDCSITRPWHSWNAKEAERDWKAFKKELQQANQLARQEVDKQRRNATIEGTEEHKLFTNENKHRFDAMQHLQRQGRWGG